MFYPITIDNKNNNTTHMTTNDNIYAKCQYLPIGLKYRFLTSSWCLLSI